MNQQAGAKRFGGVVVPMVTPFTADGQLDEPAVRRIIEHLIGGEVAGVFILGTTGENASIAPATRARLVAVMVEQVRSRAMIYVGISDTCIANSIAASEEYTGMGVDACVAHLPPYYSLTPEEQFTYFATLAERISAPLMIYNIPSTTHMSIPIEVVKRLAGRPNIIGLKDSERNEERLENVLRTLGGRDDFTILVGATLYTAKGLALGANGSVPSVGNLTPGLCQRLHECGVAGDRDGADHYQRLVDEVGQIYQRGRTLGQSLGALKAAMGVFGLCEAYVLPPLTTPDLAEQQAVREECRSLQKSWWPGPYVDDLHEKAEDR